MNFGGTWKDNQRIGGFLQRMIEGCPRMGIGAVVCSVLCVKKKQGDLDLPILPLVYQNLTRFFMKKNETVCPCS